MSFIVNGRDMGIKLDRHITGNYGEDSWEDDPDQPEPWDATGMCSHCGEEYVFSDQSPDYVKAGFCSRDCAEVSGFFKTKIGK
jgi:hypothetical protein